MIQWAGNKAILIEHNIVDQIKKYKSIVSYEVEYQRDRGYNIYIINLTINEAQYLAEYIALGDIKDNIYPFVGALPPTYNIKYV